MRAPKTLIGSLITVITFGCAPTQPTQPTQTTQSSLVAAPPAEPTTTEGLAEAAERELSSAEAQLDQLEPDAAARHLDAARKYLTNAKIDAHPEAQNLLARHKELNARLPSVRTEARRVGVNRAKEKIDEARASLKTIVAELKKGKPDEAQVNAARAAVEALKVAIDEAKQYESGDLAYARYSLEARKDLRTQRDLVESRWVEVGVENSREDIKRALSDLTAALKRILSKDVTEEDFVHARAAADEVQKAVERGQPLVTKNAKFASYVSSARIRVQESKRSIDERQLRVGVDRQKARVEEGRRTLADALAQLQQSGVDDAQFGLAEAAIKEIAEVLESGKQLQSKDGEYARYALEVGKRLNEANQRIEKRRLEVAVAAKKAEVDAAKTELQRALARLAARDPVNEQFEEAKTAATVVEKTLASAEAVGQKDARFGSYLADVRRLVETSRVTIDKRKLEVEVDHQRRRVEEALAEMKNALSLLPSSDDVSLAEAAVAAADKSIDAGEPYAAKDAAYGRFAAEARKRTAEGKAKIQTRREDIAMDLQKAKVQMEIENLKGAVAALNGFSANAAAVNAALEAVKGAQKAIDSGKELEQKLPKYAAWAGEARKTVDEQLVRIQRRNLEMTVDTRKGLIDEGMMTARASIEVAKRYEATSKEVAAATAALKAVSDALAKNAKLEGQDRGYASFAASTRKQLDRFQADLDEAKHIVMFREGPLTAMTEGLTLVKSVSDAMALQAQRDAYSKALARFQACEKDSARMVEERQRVGAIEFPVGEKRLKGNSVSAKCGEYAGTAEGKLSSVNAVIAFYDGPAKSFTKGRDLGKAGKKNEALAQFESCLEKGKILQYKHPDLSKQQFDVAGKKTTLPAVVADCQNEAKALRMPAARAKR